MLIPSDLHCIFHIFDYGSHDDDEAVKFISSNFRDDKSKLILLDLLSLLMLLGRVCGWLKREREREIK